MKSKIIPHINSITRHRNGVTAEPFYAVDFVDQEGTPLVAVVFHDAAYVAVFPPSDPTQTMRGDYYLPALRQAIRNHEGKEIATADADYRARRAAD